MKTTIVSKGNLSDVKPARHSPDRLFADGTAEMIVHWLREEHPGDKAGAISALMFYINRAGENLSDERRGVLNHAKTLLQEGEAPKKRTKKKESSGDIPFPLGNPGGKIGGMKTTTSTPSTAAGLFSSDPEASEIRKLIKQQQSHINRAGTGGSHKEAERLGEQIDSKIAAWEKKNGKKWSEHAAWWNASGTRSANEGYGFHGQAGEAKNDADAAFSKAVDHLVAKKHFPTAEDARDFLDSNIGRHLHDELTHHTKDSDLSKLPDEDLTRNVRLYKRHARSLAPASLRDAIKATVSGTFQLSINIGNAAFQDGNMNSELAQILRDVADKVENGDTDTKVPIHDSNGNRVGQFGVPDFEEDGSVQVADAAIGQPKDPAALGQAVNVWLQGSGEAADDAFKKVLVNQGVITQEQADSAYCESGAREHDLVHVFLAEEGHDQGGQWLEVRKNGAVDLY